MSEIEDYNNSGSENPETGRIIDVDLLGEVEEIGPGDSIGPDPTVASAFEAAVRARHEIRVSVVRRCIQSIDASKQ